MDLGRDIGYSINKEITVYIDLSYSTGAEIGGSSRGTAHIYKLCQVNYFRWSSIFGNDLHPEGSANIVHAPASVEEVGWTGADS